MLSVRRLLWLVQKVPAQLTDVLHDLKQGEREEGSEEEGSEEEGREEEGSEEEGSEEEGSEEEERDLMCAAEELTVQPYVMQSFQNCEAENFFLRTIVLPLKMTWPTPRMPPFVW